MCEQNACMFKGKKKFSFWNSKTSINRLIALPSTSKTKHRQLLRSFLHTAHLSQNQRPLALPFPSFVQILVQSWVRLSLKHWTSSVLLTSMPNFKGMALGTQQLWAFLPEDGSSVPNTCNVCPKNLKPASDLCKLLHTGLYYTHTNKSLLSPHPPQQIPGLSVCLPCCFPSNANKMVPELQINKSLVLSIYFLAVRTWCLAASLFILCRDRLILKLITYSERPLPSTQTPRPPTSSSHIL